MGDKLEKEVQREILDWLDIRGAMPCILGQKGKVKKSKYMRIGMPDIVGIWQGSPLYIEVKKKGGRASSEQIEFLREVQEKGGIAFIAYSLEDVISILEPN